MFDILLMKFGEMWKLRFACKDWAYAWMFLHLLLSNLSNRLHLDPVHVNVVCNEHKLSLKDEDKLHATNSRLDLCISVSEIESGQMCV